MIPLPKRIVWNGLVIGDDSWTADPLWSVRGVDESLLGAAAPEVEVGKRVQMDGQWSTTAYLKSIAGGLEGKCEASSEEECDRQMRRFRGAMNAAINPSPLTIHEASGPKTIFVRRDGTAEAMRTGPRTFEWAATVVADDPVWWWGGQTDAGGLDDSYAQTLTTGLPNRSGGLTFPISFPISFPSTGSTGDLSLTFDGSARMTWRISGPVLNPLVTVENANGTRTMAWQLSLGADEYLDVDPRMRTSKLQGQSSRTPWMRQWPELTPGENSVRFRADGYNSQALLTVLVRPLA